MDLLEHAPHTVHKVAIPPDEVRLSGLLKDRILIHHPESTTTAEMALLEEGSTPLGEDDSRLGQLLWEGAGEPVWPRAGSTDR